MPIATTESIAGCASLEIQPGMFGVIVRNRGTADNLTANIRYIVGSKPLECTRLIGPARQQALERLGAAAALGAGAVV